jgi:hypothetical protein
MTIGRMRSWDTSCGRVGCKFRWNNSAQIIWRKYTVPSWLRLIGYKMKNYESGTRIKMTTIGNRERIAWIFCFRKWKFQQINGVTLSQMWQSGHCHTMSEKKNDRWTKYLANYTNSYNSIIIVKTNETGVGVLPEIILRRLKSLRSPSTSPPPPWVAILYIYHRKRKKSHHPKIEIIQIHSANL